MNFESIDLSNIQAVGHNGSALQFLIKTKTGFALCDFPAPQQAIEGLRQLSNSDTNQPTSPRLPSAFTNTQSKVNPTFMSQDLIANIVMIPVESSTIQAIGYDSTLQLLQIDFTTQRRYRYANFTVELWLDFLQSDSKGKFLNQVIKPFPDRFPFSQVF